MEINNRVGCDISKRAQLAEDLRQLILSGGLDPKRPISTETELAAAYQLSRTTVRKALHELTCEGLLRSVRGVGSFAVIPEKRVKNVSEARRLLALFPECSGDAATLELYNRTMVGGLADCCFEYGVTLELGNEFGRDASELIAGYRNGDFCGVVWERPNIPLHPMIETLRDAGVPQVTVSRRLPGIPAVFFDYQDGIREAVHFLWSIGHREIIFLDLDNPEEIFGKRQECFAAELARHGVKNSSSYVYREVFNLADAGTLDRIDADHPGMTALVVSVVHLKFLHPKYAGRLERFSLLAFGESEESRRIPGLSVLREPRHQVGFRAAEMIFSPPENCGSAAIYLSGELSIGKSCHSPGTTERK